MRVIKLRRQDLKDMEDGASIEFSSLGIKLIVEPLETEEKECKHCFAHAEVEGTIWWCDSCGADITGTAADPSQQKPSHPKIDTHYFSIEERGNWPWYASYFNDKIKELITAVNTLQEK